MKKLVTTHNGGIPFHLDSLRWMEQGIKESIGAICQGLALDRPAIKLFGAGVNTAILPENHLQYTIEPGAIFQDNEIFIVPAHTIECPSGHQAYWDIEDRFDPSGVVAFRNGEVHNIFLERIIKLHSAPQAPAGKPLHNAVPSVSELLKGFNGISRAELTLYIHSPQMPEILPQGTTYDFVTGQIGGNLQGWSVQMPGVSAENTDLWATKAVVISDNPFAGAVPIEWAQPIRVFLRIPQVTEHLHELKASLMAIGLVDNTAVNTLVNNKIPEVSSLLEGIEQEITSLTQALNTANQEIIQLSQFKTEVQENNTLVKLGLLETKVNSLESNIAVTENLQAVIRGAILSDRQFIKDALMGEG